MCGDIMTKREKEILSLVKKDPLITQKEIASKLGIKRSSVGVHISNLIKKGKIKGKGYIVNDEKYISVIGGANMDITGFSSQAIIMRDSNPGNMKLSVGGVGRNIAENLAKLDIPVKLFSAVGEDLYGDRIIDQSRNSGVDMSNVLKLKTESTSTYLSIINSTGEMEVAISAMDIIDEITVDYLESRKQIINNSFGIVIDTNLKKEVIDYIFLNFKEIPIFVDTVSTTKALKVKEHLEDIYTLKPNLIEAKRLLDIPLEQEVELERVLKQLIEKGLDQVFISNGPDGILFGNEHSIGEEEPMKTKVINTTGAGDAFMAGLVYAYYKDLSIQQAAIVAMYLSKVTIESERTISQKISETKITEVL